jgi:hypothetical protein
MLRIFAVTILLASINAQANEKLLFIGDSHSVMAFGRSVQERLGPGVRRYAVAASQASDWLNKRICPDAKTCAFTYGYSTPAGDFSGAVPSWMKGIDGLLNVIRPKTVVIALGTNDADQRCHLTTPADLDGVEALLRKISGRKCFWIGPPDYEVGPVHDACGVDYNPFVDRLRDRVVQHGCIFIDSRRFLNPATGQPIQSDLDDQIHFSDSLGRYWGERAAGEIGPILSRPLM